MMKSTSKAKAEPESPNFKAKILFAATLIIGAATILGFGVWWFYMFGTAELAAKCDNGYTVWRRDAWLSYEYEIRNGTTILESGLRLNPMNNSLRDALGNTHCTFLGGG